MSNNNLPMMPAMTPVVPQQYAYPGPSLRQLWTIAWAYRVQAVAIAGAITVLGAIVIKLLPKTYEATATVLIAYEINDPIAGQEFPIGLLGSYISTQMELMESNAVLVPVIEKLGIHQYERYQDFDGTPEELRETILESLRKNLSITQGDWGSHFIYINYAAETAQEAAAVANAVTEEYLARKSSWVLNPASDREKRYTEKLEEFRRNVDEAQQRVTEFRQRAGLIDLDNASALDMDRLTALEKSLLEAESTKRGAELRLSTGADVDDAVLESSTIQDLKGRLSEQQSLMAELRTSLGGRHPQVQELQSQINQTQGAIRRETSTYSGSAQATLRRAEQQVKQLQTEVANQRDKVLEVRRLQEEGGRYTRELEAAKVVYDQALNGYDQILLASGSQYTNVKVVAPATEPLKPSKPKSLAYLFMVMVMGGGLGVGMPVIYEFFNRRIRCADDLERDFGVPVLVELLAAPRAKELGA